MAVNEIRPFLPWLNEIRNDFGRMLQVAVHRNGGAAFGGTQAAGKRSFLAEIARHADELQAVIHFARMAQHGVGCIRTAIVDADYFVGKFQTVHNRQKAFQKFLNTFGFVMKGENE